jgi:hypothetical protein
MPAFSFRMGRKGFLIIAMIAPSAAAVPGLRSSIAWSCDSSLVLFIPPRFYLTSSFIFGRNTEVLAISLWPEEMIK